MSTSSAHPLRDRLPTYVPNADWHSDHTKASFASAATYHHLKQSSSILRTSVLFLKIAFSTPPDPPKKQQLQEDDDDTDFEKHLRRWICMRGHWLSYDAYSRACMVVAWFDSRMSSL